MKYWEQHRTSCFVLFCWQSVYASGRFTKMPSKRERICNRQTLRLLFFIKRLEEDHKPSSVPRFGYPGRDDDHSSGTTVACRLQRHYPRTSGGPPLCVLLFGLAPDGVYHAFSVTGKAVSSYLAFSPLPRMCGAVYFLWHFPWGRPRSPLATILPCGARTFLQSA